MGFQWNPRGGSSLLFSLLSTVSRSNWNFEMLVFAEGGKPEYPEKNPRSRDENQQQTQPTFDAKFGNRTRTTLVGGLHGRQMLNHCSTSPIQMLQIGLLSSQLTEENISNNKYILF